MITEVLVPLLLTIAGTRADYDCVCNYNIDITIHTAPDIQSAVVGHMYEFDCKPSSTMTAPGGFLAIQFEKKIGYVETNSKIQRQVCSGQASPDDLFPTTQPPITSTSQMSDATTVSSSIASTTHHPATTTTTRKPATYTTTSRNTMPLSTTTRMTTMKNTMPLSTTTRMTTMKNTMPLSTTTRMTTMKNTMPLSTTTRMTTMKNTMPLSTTTRMTTMKNTMPLSTTTRMTTMKNTMPLSTTTRRTTMKATTQTTEQVTMTDKITNTPPTSTQTSTPYRTTEQVVSSTTMVPRTETRTTTQRVESTTSSIIKDHIDACPDHVKTDVKLKGGFLGQFNEFCFELVDWLRPFDAAESHCQITSGHLVAITNQQEQDYIGGLMARHQYVNSSWIGLNDRSGEGIYNWTSGAPFFYNNFQGDFNQHTIKDHYYNDCFVLMQGGEWSDVPCGLSLGFFGVGEKHPFICQYNITAKLQSLFDIIPVFVG